MSKAILQPDPSAGIQQTYEVQIKGHLTPLRSETFEGMQLTLTRNGETLITGEVVDQAALHGLLARIRDLNLTLISVTQVKPERHARPCTKRSKETEP